MKKFMAGAIGAVLMTLPSAAFAECVINNTQADAELQKMEGIYGSDLGAVRRDMRQLRASAYILKRYGQDEACQRVVETISQVLRDPKAAAKLLHARQTQGRTLPSHRRNRNRWNSGGDVDDRNHRHGRYWHRVDRTDRLDQSGGHVDE